MERPPEQHEPPSPADETPRLAVLISGTGSNLGAILQAIEEGQLHARVTVVVSNRAAAAGLSRARDADIPTEYFPLRPFRVHDRTRREYDGALAELVAGYDPELVVLAGWMHILGAPFLDRFRDRVLNLHPALPGTFPGTRAIERAWAAFQRGEVTQTGVMVHQAIEEVDAGPVVLAEPVPIHATDDLARLEERIHRVEHRLIVGAIQKVLATQGACR